MPLCNWDPQFRLAWLVMKSNSAKRIYWGAPLAVYLKWMFSFHAAWSILACNFLFFPALSCQTTSTSLLSCLHFSNWAHVGSTMTLFISEIWDLLTSPFTYHYKPIVSWNGFLSISRFDCQVVRINPATVNLGFFNSTWFCYIFLFHFCICTTFTGRGLSNDAW